MKQVIWWISLGVLLSSCALEDETTIVVDDHGRTHHTKHFLKDKRGANYFPEQVNAIGKKRFVFDPNQGAWAAYAADGLRVMTGSGSGGSDFCQDINEPCRTVTGSFKIYAKKGEDCVSKEYPIGEGGAKMPYCMYFYRGYTIHASYAIKPPANLSHGCIWVLPSAAKWLNEAFLDVGSEVVVLAYQHELEAHTDERELAS